MEKELRVRRARRQKSPEAPEVGTFKGEGLTEQNTTVSSVSIRAGSLHWMGRLSLGHWTEPHEETNAQND